ncbi:MAG TPA: DUF2275 domain-containing protein [Smithellaceae bacterium]|nr:DUF2275 domain-containing protein [Smithellaceae bacterium]HRS90173.1 DUF2275 domain-containing protein [Smithellaceae bacterium]HRV27140.1 DUF2275 domain-containing protein [Smithellaceae bacterium]
MMKNCKDMENKISLYLDNVLSAADKQAVEKHLKSCPQCVKALADMQKVKAMTGKLSEVEPPPWFKQKVMARVRAEAEKKNFAEKWFYPLRVKVPVQVFATIFIVVAAVYIYRAGNEQFKEVMPSAATAPMMEEQLPLKKDLPGKEKELAAVKGREADAACVGKSCKVDGKVLYDRAEEKLLPSASGKADIAASPAPIQAADKDAAAEVFKTKSPTFRTSMEKSGSSVGLTQENSLIIIRTSEVQHAVAQVEKILAEYSAAKISKQSTEAKIIFKAEISKEKLKDLIEKLKTTGAIEDKVAADIDAAQQVPVVIEIREN